ncbi:hypothetical protein LCGC14_2867330, partial [marine sediment metagenome]
ELKDVEANGLCHGCMTRKLDQAKGIMAGSTNEFLSAPRLTASTKNEEEFKRLYMNEPRIEDMVKGNSIRGLMVPNRPCDYDYIIVDDLEERENEHKIKQQKGERKMNNVWKYVVTNLKGTKIKKEGLIIADNREDALVNLGGWFPKLINKGCTVHVKQW